MEADEALGTGATISSVLYANINHPEWKTEYPAWSERCKQILKKWRALPNDKKAPYLTQARDNRAAIRMKKTQQVISLCKERKAGEEKYIYGYMQGVPKFSCILPHINLYFFLIWHYIPYNAHKKREKGFI